MTALLVKAQEGDWIKVEQLLIAGADSTAIDDQGFTALHHACYNGHVNVAQVLIKYGSQRVIKQAAETGKVSPLFLASFRGNLELVKLLVQAGGTA